jgi:hypothetical protein
MLLRPTFGLLFFSDPLCLHCVVKRLGRAESENASHFFCEKQPCRVQCGDSSQAELLAIT